MTRLRRALVCTHHMFEWAGSELVALEFAEELQSRGLDVEMYIPFFDPPAADRMVPDTIPVVTRARDVNLQAFDLVYAQHQTQVAVYAAQAWGRMTEPPFLVCGHLSPFMAMEYPGHFCEPKLADIVLANSPETKKRIEQFDVLSTEVTLWRNPAPRAFDAAGQAAPQRLRSVLSVSNHRPKEVSQLLDLFEARDITVTRVGRDDGTRRVTPDLIKAHDAVIANGKTVQYALRSRRPVYCYDDFGGPGWLSDQVFEKAADKNFSGRGWEGVRPADALFEDITEGFAEAWSFAASMPERRLSDFRLEDRVDWLFDKLETAQRPRASQVAVGQRARFRARLKHERALYGLVDGHYRQAREAEAKALQRLGVIEDLERRLGAQPSVVSRADEGHCDQGAEPC